MSSQYFIRRNPGMYYEAVDRSLVDILEVFGRHFDFTTVLFAVCDGERFEVDEAHDIHMFGNGSMPADAPAWIRDACRAAINEENPIVDGQPVEFEISDLIHDDKTYTGRWISAPVYLVGNTPIGAMFGYVDEPVRFSRKDLCLVVGLAELISHEVMKNRVEAARSRHFELLITQVQESLSIVSPESRILYESPSASEMLGYAPGEIQSMPSEELMAMFHPDDLPAVLDVRAELFADPHAYRSFTYRMRHRDGTWRTLLATGSNLIDEPSIGGLVYTARDVTEQNAHDARLHYEAEHDSLTGLLNRGTIERQLQRLLETPHRQVAFVYVDVDNFKLVNDTFGHFVGDEVLRLISRRLDTFVEGAEVVGRFGGDEFVLLVPDVSQDAARARAAQLMEHLRRPLHVLGNEIAVGCSIAVAHAPEDGHDFDTVFRSADAALYRMKSAGGGAVALYNAAIDNAIRERHMLGYEFAAALERDELFLEYQSIVSLETGATVGMEALVRWNHPTRGRLMPLTFIPVIEELGLAGDLGRWVLDRAAQQARASGIQVNVNVSADHLREPTFVRDVMDAIARHALMPRDLALEITETASITNDAVGIDVLARLREAGVTVAIDDFGTGYSGLSALRDYPAQVMKLDRVFLERIESDQRDQKIVRAVIDVAEAIGISVVVEGIETAEQARLLRALGCMYGQGYYFSRPQRLDEEDAANAR